uniref:Vacuolar protein-sorting-associated protein 36 n=1 Tax=Nelumbo nucifera TaxID=4432 RepID=A0A822YAC1_NELNU|nr:TPA_asm: hypothetical protein HUJ06_030720 [Nelumbo nucifera]
MVEKSSTSWILNEQTYEDCTVIIKTKHIEVDCYFVREKVLSGEISTKHVSSGDQWADLFTKGLSSGRVNYVTSWDYMTYILSLRLADFVRIPLERAGGMIALIDVYCLFNRARGTELISPEDLLQACAIWEKFDVPVMLRKFDSGVMVIQNKSHSDEEVLAKIKSIVLKSEALKNGISPSDAAIALGIAPLMAKEHLLTAESKGLLCRDISPEGFRFYINLFKDIDPNNIYLVKDHGNYQTWVSTVTVSGLDINTRLFLVAFYSMEILNLIPGKLDSFHLSCIR